ncbi:MAG: beta-galactosidase trimerization domain-containing protein, partial [Verrucomicrobia bacterium]|nr:beta-galactosidase trimerization domain-containing protein [Verrucomicrobiota bacterium]
DHYTATRHPKWVAHDGAGKVIGTPPFEAGFYQTLCVNTPYRDFLKEHTAEILEAFPTDGLFFDIVRPEPCTCRYCREKMLTAGLEPSNAEIREQFGLQTINEFKEDMTRFVRERNADCTIFYNAGHIGPRHRPVKHAYSHFELETLPSGQCDCLGHTGKFHTSWGDFHSFKNLPALRYECLRMLTHGAKCLIGDQLAPSGQIDPHVYQLVGEVYQEVEQKEPWCTGSRRVTEKGVLTPEEFTGGEAGVLPDAIKGAVRMLEQGGHQFDVLGSASDFAKYRVLVLPDQIPVSAAFARTLEEYVGAGGSVMASFASGMDEQQTRFAANLFGVSLVHPGPRDLSGNLVRGKACERHDYCEYLVPKGPIGNGLPQTEHAMYRRGMAIQAGAGAEVLAPMVKSFFDRTYRHFCSHRQTPSSGEEVQPGIVRKERCIYFSSPIFSQFNDNAPRWCKQLVLNALQLLLPEPLVKHDGPSTLQVTLTQQEGQGRWILHLLHFIPERRSEQLDVIEDVIPLFKVKVWVKAPAPVREVTLVPEQAPLAFRREESYVGFEVDRINGHSMVSLTFG